MQIYRKSNWNRPSTAKHQMPMQLSPNIQDALMVNMPSEHQPSWWSMLSILWCSSKMTVWRMVADECVWLMCENTGFCRLATLVQHAMEVIPTACIPIHHTAKKGLNAYLSSLGGTPTMAMPSTTTGQYDDGSLDVHNKTFRSFLISDEYFIVSQ